MKKVFRYGYSSIFAVVGLIISFLTFSYYSGITASNKQEEIDKESFTYSNEVYITTYGSDFFHELMDAEQFENVDITLTEMPVFINEAGVCCTGDVVISGDELVYSLVVGRYPSKEELESGERVVVLGQALKRYTKSYDGDDYITICGDDYRVTGYLGCSNSVVLDHFVINYADCLGEGLYDDINDYASAIGDNIMFQSNSVSSEQIRDMLAPYTESEKYYLTERELNPKFFAENAVTEENKQHAILTYVFSIVIIILVIEYWLICRRREYAIRKAFGYSSDRLVLRIIIELCIYVVVAILISELLLVVFKVFDERAVIFSVKDFSDRLLNLLRYSGLTICILVVRPIYKIYRDNPAKMLVNKERI